ncbi:MAG: class I SAM-dependent methyltransferase [Desulfofustis sp.]|nr:class I SAM-dependent methyltransferase [Desulfofustis sp.]NNF46995.1 class I SAM-dependent methyltransferase [Desulfofustis sp.]NNK56106.1 class I SAM-dependent methyltransferase [Desulfofustis sp.]
MKKNQLISVYDDIDWQLLWQQSRSAKSWKSKDAKDWDKKARAFAGRTRESPYVGLFLSQIKLHPELSVLDVGCGPGTLALPIATQVRRVTAIDYSQGMLDLLNREAATQEIKNVSTVHCGWEDEWSEFGVEPHDVVIASRSMNIPDLSGALQKLGRYATSTIHVVERIAPSPFDPNAFAALGREFKSGPDYIYTVNMLYQLGIHPRISKIELARDQQFASLEAAVEGYAWMFRDLQSDERQMLEKYIKKRIVKKDDDHLIVRRDHVQRWALLSWSVEDLPSGR